MRSAPTTHPQTSPLRSSPRQAKHAWSPFDGLPGYRALRLLPTRGPCRELLAMREGPSGFRRLCTLRLARADDPFAGSALATEAAILARLHYPTILPAYDFFVVDGWMALVLAYDGALTFDKLLMRPDGSMARLDGKSGLFVAHAIFDALGHAHGKKGPADQPLVHGDVHPANVLLRAHGHVVLRGFRGSEPIPTMIRAGSRMDPGPYGAPELKRGGPATQASDCYGAAAILWELLVGRPLPGDETPSLLRLRPDLPSDFAAVVDVCLARNPNQRRVHATTVAATVRGAVDLLSGRDGLQRLFDQILPRSTSFPTGSHGSVLRSGSIPDGWLKSTFSTPDQTNPEDARADFERTEHPGCSPRGGVSQGSARPGSSTPIPQPLPQSQAVEGEPGRARISHSTGAEAFHTSESRASRDAAIRAARFDEETPTLPSRSGFESKPPTHGMGDRDTIDDTVTASACEASNALGVRDTLIDGEPEETIPFSLLPPERSCQERHDVRAEPRSHPPVASDFDAPEPPSFWGRELSFRVAFAAALVLLMTASWMVGRYLVGPAWHAFVVALEPEPVSPFLYEEGSRAARAHGVLSSTAASRTTAHPSATVSPTPGPPLDLHLDSASDATSPSGPAFPVLFHQSALRVEGPPHGVVFVNGIRAGPTGEWILTRGCGLRFLRLGSEPREGELGFRWLTRGQSARLPCGGSLSTPSIH